MFTITHLNYLRRNRDEICDNLGRARALFVFASTAEERTEARTSMTNLNKQLNDVERDIMAHYASRPFLTLMPPV